MAVIDASVWIARFKTDDNFHEQAKHIIQSLIANLETISIPAIAFTEVAGAIKRTTKNGNTARKSILYHKISIISLFSFVAIC